MKFALVSVVLGACTSITGGGGTDPVGSAAGSAAPKKGAGFSASLAAELEGSGGSAAVPATPDKTPLPMTGSATPPMTGNATPPMTGSATPPMTGSATPDKTPPPTTPDKLPPPTAGSVAGSAAVAKIDPKTENHNSVPEPIVGNNAAPARPSNKRAHVDPGPALGTIKLDLEPNWDRDYDTAGSISFVLKVPTTNDTRVFSFHYGFDLNGAPTDREAYKKFLVDQKVLTVTLDRQRGSAWYLEGTDADGNPAFRMLVTYGGKRLICSGSLYKDRESTALGADLRDKVVNTAKKICETLTL